MAGEVMGAELTRLREEVGRLTRLVRAHEAVADALDAEADRLCGEEKYTAAQYPRAAAHLIRAAGGDHG